MPRVITKKKNKAGAARKCGKCGTTIKPGDTYRTWSFRYGGAHYRCSKPVCAPRRSDLTQSRMAEVYSAVEDAESAIYATEDVSEMVTLLENVAEVATDLAGEYNDAAEHFGGVGQNADRAEELEQFAGDLEGYAPDEPDEDTDDEERERLIEAARDEAQDLLNSCP